MLERQAEMGLNAASVHIRVGSGPGAQHRVAGAVRRVLTADGFREVEQADEQDRTVILHPSTSGDWLTVFDSAAELDALAAALSRETGSEAVCSSIEQSDAMRLALYRLGQAVDALTARGRQGGGQPRHWLPLLAAGATPEQFRGALERSTVFAEDKLVALAGLLGLNRDLCLAHVEELLDAPGRPVGLRIHFRREGPLAR
jgi:hypothetical protein